MNALDESYEHCRSLSRRAASSFYFAFRFLPRDKRRAMYALYAFLRRADDIGDSGEVAETKMKQLAEWRRQLEAALAGHPAAPLFPALADAVGRFGIPPRLLHAALDGVETDLSPRPYETFAELSQYCYRVAGVVGEACLHIWGFDDQRALEPAVQCGTAFQLTNILRDLKEDADCGRLYLPLEDMRRFDYKFADLQAGIADERFRELVRFEAARAEEHYELGGEVAPRLAPDGRRVFIAMFGAYRALLGEIQRREGELLARRISLSRWQKLRVLARTMSPNSSFQYPREND